MVRRRVSGRGARLSGRGVDPTPATWGAATLNLAFLLGLVWIFASQQFVYRVSPTMLAIFWLPIVAMVLTALGLVATARARTAAPDRWPARLAQAVVLITLALFPAFLARWNLLGFHF